MKREQDIYWQPGVHGRARHMAAALLMLVLAFGSFVTIVAAISGCATFVNRGDAFSKNDHIASPGKMVKTQGYTP